MSTRPHISEEDLALYGMQALTSQEERSAQAHLEVCAYCRAALAETMADVSLVGMSVEQQPPPEGARQRLMVRIANTPQEAPPTPRPVAVMPSREEPRKGVGWGWLGWAAAAAMLAVAAYLGYGNHKLQQQLSEDRGQIAQLQAGADRAEALTEALTSPEAKQVTLSETKGPAKPVGHATYLSKRGTLIFVASNLRPVPASKTYELWLIPANGKAPVAAGLFRPDANGSASVVMPKLPEGVEAKAFGVTIEDAQGSATPTLPIVMAGQ
ncbi:MAG: anti-sigma factor [Acidobacteriaceae bacterium]|nr:anti-sigma factor [Acidobacteriaceae bacterium]